MSRSKILLISGLIFISSLLIRTYHLDNSMVFVGDQEYQSTYAMTLVKDFHPIWIGVSAAHTGFYLGPLFTYFTAFWLFLSSGDPIITGYVAAFIGSIVSVLIFLFIMEISNKPLVAFLSSLVYSFSPLMIFYDRVYWNPMPLPVLTIGLLYCLYKAIKGKKIFWILYFFLFALVLHTHLSILPLGLLGLYYIVRLRRDVGVKFILLSFLGFLLLYSPLIVFDLNHNFSNLTTPFRFRQIVNGSASKINVIYHLDSLNETLGRFWFLNIGGNESDEVLFDCGQKTVFGRGSDILLYSDRTSPKWYMSLPLTFAILIFFINKRSYRDLGRRMILQFFIIILISFLFFPGGAFEFYLLGIFPILAIMVGYLADSNKRYIKYAVVIFTVIISTRGVFVVVNAKDDFGIKAKKDMVIQASSIIKNGSFEIFQNGRCHNYEGFRYLFKVYGKTPDRSSTDNNFGWLYPDEINLGPVDYKVIIQENRVPFGSGSNLYREITSGGFSALIYKN